MKKKQFTTLLLILIILLIATMIFFFVKPKDDVEGNTISFYTFVISNELINKGESPIYITKDSFRELYTWERLDDASITKIISYFSDYNISVVEQKDLPTTNEYFKIDIKFYKKNHLTYKIDKYYDNKLNSSFGGSVEFKKGVWNYSSDPRLSTQF